jgi:glycosyltransferase involved in cell wall biosynthesis
MANPSLTYVLISPARNEEAFLETTIRAVVSQTVLPLRWVIVSDGSTDRTEAIAADYCERYPWIRLVARPPREVRDFAGKVAAFNAGFDTIKHLDFDIVGSLDADLSFASDYFEFLLGKFAGDPQLGVAGCPFSEEGVTYDYTFSSVEHVSGACQMFRRDCYQQIGGYVPLSGGGIDVVAVLMARMNGWRTRTFPERVCVHHRPMGSANDGTKFTANYKLGQRAYRLGFHPVWQLCRSAYQMTRRPYVSGGVALAAGYFGAMLSGSERAVSHEVAAFQGRDQMRRLRTFVGARLGIKRQ